MLVGDVLLAAAFVSYAGPFNMAFRQQLVTERWLPDITARGIPISSGARAECLTVNELLAGLQHGACCVPIANIHNADTRVRHTHLQASSRWTC